MLEKDGDVIVFHNCKQNLTQFASRDAIADLVLGCSIAQLGKATIDTMDHLPFNGESFLDHLLFDVDCLKCIQGLATEYQVDRSATGDNFISEILVALEQDNRSWVLLQVKG